MVRWLAVRWLALAVLLICACRVASAPTTELAGGAPASAMRYVGRHLTDICSERVVLRGINKMVIWTDRDGRASLPQIARTGANVVRLVWTTEGTAAELDAVITEALRNQLLPMVELHDATGKWELLPAMVDYWVNQQVLTVLLRHQAFLLLNIANEAGDDTVRAEAFVQGYSSAIARLRAAGLRVPLIIDAPSWGRDADMLLSQGPALQAADPLANVGFSVHMWWPGESAERVFSVARRAAALGLPLLVGEFAESFSGACCIPWQAILEAGEAYGFGWLAWSWGPGNTNAAHLDMTRDNQLESLWGWAREVALDHPLSIRNTSHRPASLVRGRCG